MGLRFRRSVKLFPGLRLNFSKSGISTSIGGKGATLNFGHGRRSLSLGIPGTGISYRVSEKAASKSSQSSAAAGGVQQLIQHTLVNVDDGFDVNYSSEPEETVYRIAALLAAIVVAGADPEKVIVRIAGLLPERVVGKLSSPAVARTLVWYARGLDGHSAEGTRAVRYAIDKLGFQHTELVSSAVSAVRKSLRVLAAEGIRPEEPIEWYREGGGVSSREYEAPSLRNRVPAEMLAHYHAQQLELGQARINDPKLTANPRSVRIMPVMFGLLAMLALVFAFAHWDGSSTNSADMGTTTYWAPTIKPSAP